MAIRAALKKKQLDAARSRLGSLEQRETEMMAQVDEATEPNEDLIAQGEALEADLERARDEVSALETELADLERAQQEAVQARSAAPNTTERSMTPMHEDRSAAAAELQRTGRTTIGNVRSFIRSPLLASQAAKPVGVDGINENHEAQVTSFIDMINIVDCTGMGTHRVAYEKDIPAAVDGVAGQVPTDGTPTYGYVDIHAANLTTVGYVDRGIKKQTPLQYDEAVRKAARTALRKKLAQKVTAAVLASELNDVLNVSSATIDAAFLSNLILAYGGDEGVEGAAVLNLAKDDLKAFAALRGKNEYLPVYSINPDVADPNSGIIKDNYGLSCRYCLNKNVTPLTKASAGDKTMFYGNPKCAELDLFGDYEVVVDESYKLGEGLLTIRGDLDAGSDVTVNKGFVVVQLNAG